MARSQNENLKPYVIIGGGGHAKVLACLLLEKGAEVFGYIDFHERELTNIFGLTFRGSDDEFLENFENDRYSFVNGVGSVGDSSLRQRVFEKYCAAGASFPSIVHSSAFVSKFAQLGDGVQVMAGCVVQAGCVIGCNSLLNSKSSIDHDGLIGSHCHIGPGVTVSGGVQIGTLSHIGAGSTIIQGLRIGSKTLVAAGAVVINNVEDELSVRGVPAKPWTRV